MPPGLPLTICDQAMPTKFLECVTPVHAKCSSTSTTPSSDAGINCGVLLIRNTDWAREFFADVGQYAYMPKKELVGTMRPVCHPPVISHNFYSILFSTTCGEGEAHACVGLRQTAILSITRASTIAPWTTMLFRVAESCITCR